MNYPEGVEVPKYLERGISLADMLENYKKYQRSQRYKRTDDMEDGDSTAPSRAVSPNPRAQRHGIRVPVLAPRVSGGIQKLALRVKAKLENLRKPDQRLVFLAVENIPLSSSESELICHFSSCARVAEVRIDRLHDGKSTGQALIAFESRKDANIVLDALQSSELRGREIRISVVD